ncbi:MULTISPECIES: AAA family ATPase [Nannocystis]|jgi:MoxR-like ATPase|uniref:AAA family ATPase n=1 Tax=Nannocystis TaxID=53 RepID=UPI0022701B1C|nr:MULTISPECIES: AAA family ATPase [unclassified Nannocystis]MCY0990393.1 AAA family ATPase [Nannocystis sp. ILAH1]MCY1069319.1 AAA family ATPase [Nannocystis sp. RBIL2]
MSTTPATFSISDLARRLQDGARQLEQQFLGKEEIIRLLFISALAGEHMVMVGPPGTAKSAIVRAFAQVIDARFFDYLLTRFTEPNEIFGPVDIQAFRQGTYRRRIEKMLPEAEVVFLDEIFKANSAILNSLLTLVNARRFTHGTSTVRVPLISLFAASNEVPTDEALSAIFDRFLLRVRCDYLDSYHFRGLLQKGIQLEVQQMADQQVGRKVATAAELLTIQRDFGSHVKMSEEFLTTFKGMVFQIRSEGIGLSDRRVVKLLKVFASSALFDGRDHVTDADLFILRHVWNTPEQEEILQEIVGPVLDRWYESHPDHGRIGATPTSLQDLLEELRVIRETLTGSQVLSDMQLFSQLRNLGDIKAALLRMQDSPTAQRMVGEVDKLLETMFASSRFA